MFKALNSKVEKLRYEGESASEEKKVSKKMEVFLYLFAIFHNFYFQYSARKSAFFAGPMNIHYLSVVASGLLQNEDDEILIKRFMKFQRRSEYLLCISFFRFYKFFFLWNTWRRKKTYEFLDEKVVIKIYIFKRLAERFDSMLWN